MTPETPLSKKIIEKILNESEDIIRETCHKLGLRVPLKNDSIDGETMKMLMHNVYMITKKKTLTLQKEEFEKMIEDEIEKSDLLLEKVGMLKIRNRIKEMGEKDE